MTQCAVLNYYYHSKIAQAFILYISSHKLTWTTWRSNSFVLANALKVRLENMP